MTPQEEMRLDILKLIIPKLPCNATLVIKEAAMLEKFVTGRTPDKSGGDNDQSTPPSGTKVNFRHSK